MIQIETIDQLIEVAARSTYLLSNLRAYQKDFEASRAVAVLCKDEEVEKWNNRIDEYLTKIDAIDFQPLKEIISELSKKYNNEKI